MPVGCRVAVDDAVDGGAADAVFLGEVGKGEAAFGVAGADGGRPEYAGDRRFCVLTERGLHSAGAAHGFSSSTGPTGRQEGDQSV